MNISLDNGGREAEEEVGYLLPGKLTVARRAPPKGAIVAKSENGDGADDELYRAFHFYAGLLQLKIPLFVVLEEALQPGDLGAEVLLPLLRLEDLKTELLNTFFLGGEPVLQN